MKKLRRWLLLITVLVLLTPLIYSYYSYSKIKVANNHVDDFAERLIAVVNEQVDFDMTDLTEFDWDTMIVFGPYTSREEMEEKIGKSWTTYGFIGYHVLQKTFLGKHPLDDDSWNKIIFINGDQVVLDVTLSRRKVDLTEIQQVIRREEAIFSVHGKSLMHVNK